LLLRRKAGDHGSRWSRFPLCPGREFEGQQFAASGEYNFASLVAKITANKYKDAEERRSQ
jgi:hypothetical protein